jgi:Tol biopolymer transport system component
VLKPASGDWTVLTRKQKGSVWCPAWSRDGTRLFFSRWVDGKDSVFSVPTLGGDERLVLEDGGFPQVLPDRSLLVSRITEARDNQLLRFWPESGQTKLIGAIGVRATLGAFFRTFPDGREAVFFGRPASDPTGPAHLYTIDLETERTRRLAPRLTISPAAWTFPLAVSPDGDWVVFDHAIGNLHRIVAVPRDGSDGVRTLITLTNDVLFLDVGPDFSLYVDQVRQPPRLLRYSPSDHRSEEWRLPMSVGNYSLPLPDGRVLLTTKSGGKNRLAVLMPGSEPKPFIESEEETNIPVALLGRDRLLLMLGRAPTRVVAIASLATGQIVSRIAQLPANQIDALAGSPDGKTIFYVADKMVWAVPSEGGESRQLRPGDAVAVDPGGKYLIVQLLEKDGVRLVRVPLAEGAEENIPVAGDDKLGDMLLSPSAVDAEGRILTRIWSPSSWFTPAGVIDPRTGHFAPLTGTFDADMDYAAWTVDGRVITRVHDLESNLWRFRPVQR